VARSQRKTNSIAFEILFWSMAPGPMALAGKGDLWITEYSITYEGRPAYTVSIMEFRNGKVVHEAQYFADSFEAPSWRSQWVQRIA
jgi:hypothetical protein